MQGRWIAGNEIPDAKEIPRLCCCRSRLDERDLLEALRGSSRRTAVARLPVLDFWHPQRWENRISQAVLAPKLRHLGTPGRHVSRPALAYRGRIALHAPHPINSSSSLLATSPAGTTAAPTRLRHPAASAPPAAPAPPAGLGGGGAILERERHPAVLHPLDLHITGNIVGSMGGRETAEICARAHPTPAQALALLPSTTTRLPSSAASPGPAPPPPPPPPGSSQGCLPPPPPHPLHSPAAAQWAPADQVKQAPANQGEQAQPACHMPRCQPSPITPP